jgi:hypothetical protein
MVVFIGRVEKATSTVDDRAVNISTLPETITYGGFDL